MWLPSATSWTGLRTPREASPGRRAHGHCWLPGILDDHGLQPGVRHLVAAITASLGLISLITLTGQAASHGWAGRVLAAAAAIACLVTALGWLRRRWPTRLESVGFVVVGTVCMAVAAVVSAAPDVGLLGMTAGSALLTAYVICLHGALLLAMTWTVSATTLVVLSMRVATADPVLAIRGILVVVTINAFAAAAGWMALRLISEDADPDDVHPLTGFLTEVAFRARTARLVTTHPAHRGDTWSWSC